MELSDTIANVRQKHKADYVGIAELAGVYEFIHKQGGDFISEFPLSISIGIALPNAIVDLLPRRAERAVKVSYRHHAYDVINQRLDLAASELSSSLQEAGYRAFPIPASERVDDENLCASFSHKLGANLSGLGWIGKSCLLITPRHGPRVRWVTVLTDAPLQASGTPIADRCEACNLCVDSCPAEAFTGKHFRPEEPREARYKADKCNRYFKTMESKGEPNVCGLCLYVCPFGRTSSITIKRLGKI